MVLENTWIELCMKHSQVLDGYFADQTQAGLDFIDITDAVQIFVANAALLNRSQERMLVHAVNGRLLDTTTTGHQLVGLIHKALTAGRNLQQKTDLTKVDPAGEVNRAVAMLEDLLKVHTAGWPWEPIPTREKAIAAHDRGETQDLDEAFATIKGVTKEEWIALVERQKRRRPNAG